MITLSSESDKEDNTKNLLLKIKNENETMKNELKYLKIENEKLNDIIEDLIKDKL